MVLGFRSEVWDLLSVRAAVHLTEYSLICETPKSPLCQVLVEKVGQISIFDNSQRWGPFSPLKSIQWKDGKRKRTADPPFEAFGKDLESEVVSPLSVGFMDRK